jgi:NitT/TauT family transport system substrate-binding protein
MSKSKISIGQPCSFANKKSVKRTKMKKGYVSWIILLSLCIGSSVYAQKPPLTIALQDSPDMMPALVAQHSGYFSQESLETRSVVFRSGVQLIQSVIGGDAQIGICSAPEVIQAVGAGAKVRVPWGNSNLMPFAVVSRPEIRSIQELKGKKIAISSPGSLTDFLTRYVLKNKGLEPSQVNLLSIGGVSTRFAALMSGGVDASLISAAYFSRAKEAKLNLLFTLSEVIPEWPLSVICVREEMLSQREPEFRIFLKAYRHATARLKINRQEAIQALRKGLRFDDKTAAEAYDAYVKSFPADGHVAEKGMELMFDQMLESGTLKRKLSLSDVIDYRYQKEAHQR